MQQLCLCAAFSSNVLLANKLRGREKSGALRNTFIKRFRGRRCAETEHMLERGYICVQIMHRRIKMRLFEMLRKEVVEESL